MANWSKRTTRKSGNQGQRTTRTTNSNGTSSHSFSKKVGNVRTTNTISSTGKVKVTTTTTHPTLGRKTTTKTINSTPRMAKTKRTGTRRRSSGYSRGSWANEITPTGWLWIIGIVLFLAVIS